MFPWTLSTPRACSDQNSTWKVFVLLAALIAQQLFFDVFLLSFATRTQPSDKSCVDIDLSFFI